MRYDISKLKALRDNIDNFLEMERTRENQIEEEVEKRVNKAIDERVKPLIEELDKKIKTQANKD